jgi:two-component system, NtrC family, sensor histidine kinase HydH
MYHAAVPLPVWVSLVASVGQATLAVLALRVRGPLAAPLALFGADLAIWTFAEAAFQVSGVAAWHALDLVTSPLTPALGLHFVLVFVGRRRALRGVLYAAYAHAGAVSLAAGAGFFLGGEPWPDDRAWTAFFVAGVLAVALGVAWLLVAHHRETPDPDERSRTRLLLLALPLGAVFGSTALLRSLFPGVPPLQDAGTLGCALLMTVVTVRGRLFGRDLSTAVALQAAAIAAIAVGGYLVAFRVFATSTAMLVVATVTLSVVVLALSRQAFAAAGERRARLAELARMGRFSAQMAHDLRNPLAALKGAAQFLQGERAAGRPLDPHAEFVDLIVEQADRLERMIATYQRIGKLEPALAAVDLASLLRAATAFGAFAGVAVELRVDEPLPPCEADGDLLSRALENLVRNAAEAMPGGGTVTVTAEREGGHGVVVRVADTGAGMDARTRERVFDDFFTTKATGSGLGLPFVQRVAEAHGGSVSLRSREGRGTVVELHLPV